MDPMTGAMLDSPIDEPHPTSSVPTNAKLHGCGIAATSRPYGRALPFFSWPYNQSTVMQGAGSCGTWRCCRPYRGSRGKCDPMVVRALRCQLDRGTLAETGAHAVSDTFDRLLYPRAHLWAHLPPALEPRERVGPVPSECAACGCCFFDMFNNAICVLRPLNIE